MDYETFGEHQWEETGIFEFIRASPREILKHPDFRFQTPSEIAGDYDPVAQLDVTDFISWADDERDLKRLDGKYSAEGCHSHRVRDGNESSPK